MKAQRFNFTLWDTPEEKFTERYESYFELHDLYLRKVIRCKANVTKVDGDVSGVWEEREHYREILCFKDFFAGIEKIFLSQQNQWKVLISFEGMSDEVICIFRSEVAANKMIERLMEWKFGSNKPEPAQIKDI